jgi:tripartite-type tricarboxylate transporter receptor subunit TctC
MQRRLLNILSCLSALLLCYVTPLQAQQDYPNQPIRIVLGFTFGAGGANVLARHIAEQLRPIAGVPVIVENRPGAQTNIAAEYVAKSKPNGYTLFLTSGNSTFASNAHLFKKLPFDPYRSFAPITTLTRVPFVLIVNSSQNVGSVEELTRALRTKKSKGSYGSSTTNVVVISELYKNIVGVETVHIPYKGSEQIWPELAAGGLDFTFTDPANATTILKHKWARALAVTSAQRSPSMPELPTMIEAGVPGFDVTSWLAMYAPAGTPRPIVDKLSVWINQIMASDELKKVMAGIRYDPMPGTPDSLEKFHAAEIDKWGRLIKGAKIEAE